MLRIWGPPGAFHHPPRGSRRVPISPMREERKVQASFSIESFEAVPRRVPVST